MVITQEIIDLKLEEVCEYQEGKSSIIIGNIKFNEFSNPYLEIPNKPLIPEISIPLETS